MSNITITNLDTGNVLLGEGEFKDELLTFAGAATVVEGTILARDSVSLKMVPFVKGGVVNENGIPKSVLTYDVVAAGAGDESIRSLTKGNVRVPRLIIDADGDGSNIDAVVLDQLRNYAIISVDVDNNSVLDNQ